MADASAKRMLERREPPRIVSGAIYDEDARIEASVRPTRLSEYIGQKRVKENIQIAVEAGARSRRRSARPRFAVRAARAW